MDARSRQWSRRYGQGRDSTAAHAALRAAITPAGRAGGADGSLPEQDDYRLIIGIGYDF
jgi:hypothetical protein